MSPSWPRVESRGAVHALWGKRYGKHRTFCGRVLRRPIVVGGELTCPACAWGEEKARAAEPAKGTAATRQRPSEPARWLFESGLLRGRVLDYGCGRGDLRKIPELGAEEWDPWWNPGLPSGEFDTVAAVFVLDVLPPNLWEPVLEHAAGLAPWGVVYAAVRRGSRRRGWFDVRLDLESVYHRKGAFEVYKVS